MSLLNVELDEFAEELRLHCLASPLQHCLVLVIHLGDIEIDYSLGVGDSVDEKTDRLAQGLQVFILLNPHLSGNRPQTHLLQLKPSKSRISGLHLNTVINSLPIISNI